MSTAVGQSLEGATWSPWRFFRRWDFALTNSDEVVATLKIVHLSWTRRAFGTVLGMSWTLEEPGLAERFRFRRDWKSGEVIAEYTVPRLGTICDVNGHTYTEADGGEVLDEAGLILLRRPIDSWKDSFVPTLLLGEAAATEPRLEWVVLLRQYLQVREINRPAAVPV